MSQLPLRHLQTALPELPAALAERCRALNDLAPADAGEFVLLWLHHAVRADENPALETAVALAAALDRPLLVYQGLAGKHPCNNDRHHRFILQGARDCAAALAERRLQLQFHLPADPALASPLPALIRRAAAAVVEDYPAPPFPRWTRRLCAHAIGSVVAVDAACVLPMRLHHRRFDRAYAFRQAHGAEQLQRAATPWSVAPIAVSSYSGDLGFAPFDLTSDLDEAIAGCRIDHGVGAVASSIGGARAGLARWDRFVASGGLRNYARDRNDAALDGVSRLSPYLHHGHIAASRIARDALADGSAGARKFLDELLIWRELSFNLAYRADREGPHLDDAQILPAWARASFAAHAADARSQYSDEALERGRSGEPLWDASQQSLLYRGELHNNLRMSWGKALVGWSATVEQAMTRLRRLNHRYALDGSDPNSWAGLWWCLGLYDRPFQPAQPVFGALRTRPLAAHQRRLDLDRFAARCEPAGGVRSIAVVGAGLAGALAGRILTDHGHRVTLYDKGRGAGGRMSSRRRDGWQVDYGGRRLRLNAPELASMRELWLADGVIRPVENGLYAPIGPANALVRQLLVDSDVRFGQRVDRLQRVDAIWQLHDSSHNLLGEAEIVLLALPPSQAADLTEPFDPALTSRLRAVPMAPAWVVMAALPSGTPCPPLPADIPELVAVELQASDSAEASVLLEATPAWSTAHLEDPAESVATELWQLLRQRVPDLPESVRISAHRWRYARPAGKPFGTCLDSAQAFGLAGDWCEGVDAQAALRSGQALAGRVLAALASRANA